MTLKAISERFRNLASQLIGDDSNQLASSTDPSHSPLVLSETLQRVLELLMHFDETTVNKEQPEAAEPHDLQTLGEYGFNLIADLASLAGRQNKEELSHDIEALSFSLAIWIARQGGQLSVLEPIVNAIAYQANSIREPLELERLYELTGEIQNAVIPSLQHDLEKSNPTRPWRILIFNRAIIATRSHRPAVIEMAYENLVHHLPEEAPEFFRQGMQQMDALNYPQPVRQVVQKYYNFWSVERTLH